MKGQTQTILLVEDDPAHAELISRAFEPQSERFQLFLASDLAEADLFLKTHTPNLVLADLMLPDGRGIDLLANQSRLGKYPLMIMTSQGDEQAAVEAIKAGALDYIVKSESTLTDMPHLVSQVLREWGHILERKRVEDALALEKERLSVTLRSIGDGVITTDATGRITMMNSVAEYLTEWINADALDQPLEKVFNIINEKTGERGESPVKKVLESGGIVGLANHTVLIGKNGTKRVIADSGAPILSKEGIILGVVLVFRDDTENQRRQKDLQKTEKLESLSILAGGIAHDFNNALMSIIGNISLAKLYAVPGEKIYEKLEEIEKAALRTTKLTQQLLTFAKGGTPIKQVVALADLIKDTANFSLRGSNVQCHYDIPDDLYAVEVDGDQISQVITNIIFNADQSMPEGGGVKIKSENFILDHELHSLPPGTYVKTTISDQGIGIPPEHVSKIFDPYFTTKQKGSGLGLAVVHSIIENHNGYIRVRSQLNLGTTFEIFLPAVTSEVVPGRQDSPTLPISGSGKVLLMDDDPEIIKVAGEMLQSLGYKIHCAAKGEEAVQLYQESWKTGKTFDVVILDLTIPGGMGGQETLEKILEIDPQAKVIVSSGYSNDQVMSNYKQYGFKGAVSKPYLLQDLSEALVAVLRNNTGNTNPQSPNNRD